MAISWLPVPAENTHVSSARDRTCTRAQQLAGKHHSRLDRCIHDVPVYTGTSRKVLHATNQAKLRAGGLGVLLFESKSCWCFLAVGFKHMTFVRAANFVSFVSPGASEQWMQASEASTQPVFLCLWQQVSRQALCLPDTQIVVLVACIRNSAFCLSCHRTQVHKSYVQCCSQSSCACQYMHFAGEQDAGIR